MEWGLQKGMDSGVPAAQLDFEPQQRSENSLCCHASFPIATIATATDFLSSLK